jgi:hypothetical protein
MGRSYFIDVPDRIVARLRANPAMPRHTMLKALADPAALLLALRSGDYAIDLVTLGPGLNDSLRIAQRIHQVDKQIPLLLLCQPAQYLSLKHALQFTPLLGREVHCVSVQD